MSYKKSEKINGVKVIDLTINKDSRGYLFESFKKIDILNVNKTNIETNP